MAVLFTIITLALGYLSIDILKLHAPMSSRNEIAFLETGLMSTAPIIFGLTLLGMLLAWSDARRLPMTRILTLAAECSVILAVLFTLEDIPRTQASWIGLMLPVVVVVVCYWATRLFGKREKLRQRQ
jgi:protein-S-isoprenylcysteine O-methyltransferase Ste14